jgi:repressor LexA
MPEPLTDLERDVLDYLVGYLRDHTYQPSIREIGARFRIRSTRTVSELLQSLAEKGWLERDPSRSRGLRLLGLDLRAEGVSVPYVDVHLRDPVLRDPLDSLVLDRRIVGSPACFMISMVGNHMRDAGIRDGDLLVLEPVGREELDDGDLVATRADQETLVERFVHPLDQDRGATIPLPGDVLGRVLAVIRRLRTDTPAGLEGKERAREGAIAT